MSSTKPKKARGPGRPCKLNAQRTQIICTAILKGSTIKNAAAAGIGAHTLHDWRARGERDQEAGLHNRYTKFVQRYQAARAQALTILERRVFEASEEEWRAAAWILERRDPEQWGKARALARALEQTDQPIDLVITIGTSAGEDT